jgi:hypothetical protein
MLAICLILGLDVMLICGIFDDVHIAQSPLTSAYDVVQWDNSITSIKGAVFPASLNKLHMVSYHDEFVDFCVGS